jgi:putative ABC transport system permease protein
MIGAEDIKIISLVFLLLLLLPVLITELLLKLNITVRILYSTLRMLVQLSFVGIYLQYLFQFNNPFINLFYLLIMISVASFTVVNSSKLKLKFFFIPIFTAIIIPQIIVLVLFNVLTVGISHVLDAKYLVPIGGMLLGNCLSGNIITLSSFYSNVKKDEKRYIYMLALGASRFQALLPYLRESLLASINPILGTMATIGLVSLPGMMTGQILGGSVPLVAIKYQIAIMIAIFVAKFFSSFFTVLFSISIAFDPFDMLKKVIFKSS